MVSPTYYIFKGKMIDQLVLNQIQNIQVKLVCLKVGDMPVKFRGVILLPRIRVLN